MAIFNSYVSLPEGNFGEEKVQNIDLHFAKL